MKKKYCFLVFFLSMYTGLLNAQFSAQIIEPEQSGPYNYFGVKVTLPTTYSNNVIVTGYIYDQGSPDTNHPFELTVETGNLTAETESNFYQTGAANTADCQIGGVTIYYAGVPITYDPGECILKFQSAANLMTVLAQLDADWENYNDDYEDENSSLSADELDSLDEVTNFDEFATYRQFEALFGGFCSARANIEAVEIAWLANDFEGTDPNDVDLTIDNSENTIFNSSYSVKIGNNLFHLTDSGAYVNDVLWGDEITKLDLFKRLYENDAYSMVEGNAGPNFAMFNGNSITSFVDCKTNKKTPPTTVYYDNNTKRMDFKVAIHSIFFSNSVKAKAINFKKKGNNWKRARTRLRVGVAGDIWEKEGGSCTHLEPVGKVKPTSGTKKKRELRVAKRSEPDDTFRVWRTKTHLTFGTIEAPDANIYDTVFLDF